MSIKSILYPFYGDGHALKPFHQALSLAKSWQALVTVRYVEPEFFYNPGIYSDLYSANLVFEASLLERNERAEKAKELFDDYQSPYKSHARFNSDRGFAGQILAEEGRYSDLIIMARPISEYQDMLTPCLFETSRPVLMLPEVMEKGQDLSISTVTLAWDGGMQATRALQHGLDFMSKAQTVHVITSFEEDAANKAIIEYLELHGVRAQLQSIPADSGDIGKAILNKAMDCQTDLLVMGAYGHSRLREMILGGTTQHMISHATIPLLLSH